MIDQPVIFLIETYMDFPLPKSLQSLAFDPSTPLNPVFMSVQV